MNMNALAEQDLDISIEDLMGSPTADDIVTSVFKPDADDQISLEDVVNSDEEKPEGTNTTTETTTVPEVDLETLLADETPDKAEVAKTNKSALVDLLKQEIEAGEMEAFDDFDPEKQKLEDYLSSLNKKDLIELYQENKKMTKAKIETEVSQDIVSSLPEQLQIAAKYVADGGKDLTGLFLTLGQVNVMKNLDPENEDDQESIVRSYFRAKEFGSTEDIEAEIADLKDLGKLEKKAKEFKPRLDALQDQIVQQQMAEQEQKRIQREKAAEVYVNSVTEALKPMDLNGVKIDKKQAQTLYSGLTEARYQSFNGQPTNELGHLLEKYQFGKEADYKKIAKVLWLLRDETGYESTLIQNGKNQKAEEVARKLKDTKNSAGSSLSAENTPSATRTFNTKPTLKKPRGIFD